MKAYRDTKIDWVRARETRLEKLSVDKGLLRETESVQRQLTALLKCDVCNLLFSLGTNIFREAFDDLAKLLTDKFQMRRYWTSRKTRLLLPYFAC